jgi:hypothetical protein
MNKWDRFHLRPLIRKPLCPAKPLVTPGCSKEKLNVRPSAFRAVKSLNQPVAAGQFVKVLYENEQFDLAYEYDPDSSTFVPSTNGVYDILGAITFQPNDGSLDYRARVEIRVNGNAEIVIDNDFFGGNIGFLNVVSVSAILQLQAGDTVEIFATSSIAGSITANASGISSTHFEAARFPSPACT